MEVNISAIRNVTESILRQLQEQNYKETSLANYRRFYDRLYAFMSQNGIEVYNEEVGQIFFDYISAGKSTSKFYAVAVRRLNNFINGVPYRCHHKVAVADIPATFTEYSYYTHNPLNSYNPIFIIGSQLHLAIQIFFYIKPVIIISIRCVFIIWMLRQIIFIRQEGTHSSKL